jgi:hypothetical protein
MHKRVPSNHRLAIQLSGLDSQSLNGGLPDLIPLPGQRPQEIIKQILQASHNQNDHLPLTNQTKVQNPSYVLTPGSNPWRQEHGPARKES